MPRQSITTDDRRLLAEVASASSSVLPWWSKFVRNIEKQGWITERQRSKLKTFDYERAMEKTYGTRCGRKSKHWAAGLDHDCISDYTGDSCATTFFS